MSGASWSELSILGTSVSLVYVSTCAVHSLCDSPHITQDLKRFTWIRLYSRFVALSLLCFVSSSLFLITPHSVQYRLERLPASSITPLHLIHFTRICRVILTSSLPEVIGQGSYPISLVSRLPGDGYCRHTGIVLDSP